MAIYGVTWTDLSDYHEAPWDSLCPPKLHGARIPEDVYEKSKPIRPSGSSRASQADGDTMTSGPQEQNRRRMQASLLRKNGSLLFAVCVYDDKF